MRLLKNIENGKKVGRRKKGVWVVKFEKKNEEKCKAG